MDELGGRGEGREGREGKHHPYFDDILTYNSLTGEDHLANGMSFTKPRKVACVHCASVKPWRRAKAEGKAEGRSRGQQAMPKPRNVAETCFCILLSDSELIRARRSVHGQASNASSNKLNPLPPNHSIAFAYVKHLAIKYVRTHMGGLICFRMPLSHLGPHTICSSHTGHQIFKLLATANSTA